MAEDNKKSGIIVVTDPSEIARLKQMESAHEQALQDAGKKQRLARIMSKIAAKAAASEKFHIVWHKIEALHEDKSSLLRGHICESRDKHGKHFGLSVEVDYRSLYKLNPAQQELLREPESPTVAFNQHRAAIFDAGSFDSYVAAEVHMRELDHYLMHVLSEKGAEHTRLSRTETDIVVNDDPQTASGQSYSDALRTARLVKAFRTHIIEATDIPFREAVGTLVRALTSELELPFEREEKEEFGKMRVKCIFDREVGNFIFTDNGPAKPATLTHEIPTANRKSAKRHFEGILEAGVMQKQFIDWLASAARERGTISEQDFDNLYGQIQAVKGVPLRTSKLGMFAPFNTKENPFTDFRLN